MEENVASGGFGEKVRNYLDSRYSNATLLNITLPDAYVEHGNVELLRKEVGIDADTIVDRILEFL
jgi:1-deoxy-D-xylulose-5-phosphate synthase